VEEGVSGEFHGGGLVSLAVDALWWSASRLACLLCRGYVVVVLIDRNLNLRVCSDG
jgi:hypothetical protein